MIRSMHHPGRRTRHWPEARLRDVQSVPSKVVPGFHLANWSASKDNAFTARLIVTFVG